MCVASEINKRRKVDNYNEFLLGAIAPDISKFVGWDRNLSHFIDNTSYPDIDKFLKKYGDKLNNDFMQTAQKDNKTFGAFLKQI